MGIDDKDVRINAATLDKAVDMVMANRAVEISGIGAEYYLLPKTTLADGRTLLAEKISGQGPFDIDQGIIDKNDIAPLMKGLLDGKKEQLIIRTGNSDDTVTVRYTIESAKG